MKPIFELEPCHPPVWATGAHAQTLLGHLLPSPSLKDPGERKEIVLDDGDRLVCFLIQGSSSTVVYLFHGLSGNVSSNYMQRTAAVCRQHGHTVLMANHRGCGAGVGLASRPYHSGSAEDLSSVIAEGRRLFPEKRHVAIGFSLSGNALLLLLSGKRGSVKPDFGISVNAPIDLESAAKLLQEGLNRIYDLNFVFECRRDLRLQAEISRWATVYDFDELYTAPAGGFESRDHYYRSCSTKNLLALIDTPTLLITAQDDPFVHYRHYEEAVRSPCVRLHAERFGGHLGYLTRKKTEFGNYRWLDYALSRSILHCEDVLAYF